MDLEENGYVQKRIRFFMGLNFNHFKFKIKRFFFLWMC